MDNTTFKMQLVDDITFSDKYEKDGVEYGTCSNCNITSQIDGHICLSVVETDNEMCLTLEDYKNMNKIELTDGQLRYINSLYNMQHIKYHRGVFKNIVDQANNKKQLSKKQYDNLMYLLKNGRSMYEDGFLTTKN